MFYPAYFSLTPLKRDWDCNDDAQMICKEKFARMRYTIPEYGVSSHGLGLWRTFMDKQKRAVGLRND